MTQLLTRTFDQARQLPDFLQDEIAARIQWDIEQESRWNAAEIKVEGRLAVLAETAIRDFEAGNASDVSLDDL